MKYLVNDLSIAGQFNDIASFEESIDRVMAIRQIIRKFGRELYCDKKISHLQVTADMTMPQAVNKLTMDKRRALLQWLTR